MQKTTEAPNLFAHIPAVTRDTLIDGNDAVMDTLTQVLADDEFKNTSEGTVLKSLVHITSHYKITPLVGSDLWDKLNVLFFRNGRFDIDLLIRTMKTQIATELSKVT